MLRLVQKGMDIQGCTNASPMLSAIKREGRKKEEGSRMGEGKGERGREWE